MKIIKFVHSTANNINNIINDNGKQSTFMWE